jgi:hypothetical protein
LSKSPRSPPLTRANIAPFPQQETSDTSMETSQITQTIADLTERSDALRRYL